MWLGAAMSAALMAALLSIRPAHAAIHHAALVIQHASGSVVARCVAFAEDQITGLQLIERSGVQYDAQSFGSIGTAICQLDREPSTAPPGCFGSGAYWQYFHRQGGGWQNSILGASSSVLRDGDMDGWRYAAGAKQAPGNVAFASFCGAPAPPPGATATSVAKPSHQATPVPAIAPSAEATSTAAPSLQAFAPSISPSVGMALVSTGTARPPPLGSLGPWSLLGGAVVLLTGLGAFNLWRRRP